MLPSNCRYHCLPNPLGRSRDQIIRAAERASGNFFLPTGAPLTERGPRPGTRPIEVIPSAYSRRTVLRRGLVTTATAAAIASAETAASAEAAKATVPDAEAAEATAAASAATA